MALFGGIGKKLGLGSARDVFGDSLGGVVEGVGDTINEALPTIGAAVGFAMGGPQGAALGSGLGTAAQGGRSTEDILINSALAFGAGSVAQGFGIQPSTQTSGIGQFIPDTSGFSAFGMGPGAMSPDAAGFYGSGGEQYMAENASKLAGSELAGTTAAGTSGIADFFSGMDVGDYLLAGSLGLGALGLAGGLGEGEGEAVPDRPQPKGEAFGTVQDRDGKVYEIADPVQLAEYNKKLQEYQNPDFRYDDRFVIQANEGGIMNMAHGGAMEQGFGDIYEHEDDEDEDEGYDKFVRGEVSGPGTGTSDSVPARLSDGEFVLTAKSVRGAGGGDRDIGAARLYDMMAELEATA